MGTHHSLSGVGLLQTAMWFIKWLIPILLLLGLPSTKPVKNPRVQTTSIEAPDRSYFETELFNLINVKRQELELPQLITNTLLMQVAQAHSSDMAENNYLAHANLSGLHSGERITSSGYKFIEWGEVIAGGSTNPQIAIEGWFNSPEHKAVIVDPIYTEIGIGYVYNEKSKYGHYWTVVLAR